VTVTGEASAQRAAATPLQARSIVRAPAPAGVDAPFAIAPRSGATPWMNLLCKFADVAAEPRTPAAVQTMMRATYPGLAHYFREGSYNTVDTTNMVTVTRWYTMLGSRASYGADTGRLFDDCTAAADADVHFPTFYGINLFFNDSFGCCAFGGMLPARKDGQDKTFGVTWLPSFVEHNTVAHEMGHGYGLPHSGAAVGGEYNDAWDVMGSAVCGVDQEIACVGAGTIAFHKDALGWIAPACA